MAIIINIDVMLAKRKMSVTELSEKVGITMANLSILKNAELIKGEIEGNSICYCLNEKTFEIIKDYFNQLFILRFNIVKI